MRALFDQFDRVAEFPHRQRGNVESRDGLTIVRIFDPKQVKQEFVTDALTSWDAIPGLKSTAISAYIRVSTRSSITSHQSRLQLAGLFRRLAAVLVEAGMVDRTPETLSFYDCEDIIATIAARELICPGDLVAPLREIVDEIWSDETLNKTRDQHLFVRKVPFPGSGMRGRTREVLPDAVFGDIYARAAADCARIMDEIEAFRTVLGATPVIEAAEKRIMMTPLDCAVWAYRRFGDALPQLEDLKKERGTPVSAIHRVGGWKEVVRLIHPTLREIMPFAILLGCQTLFNKSVLTELSLDDIERRDLAGTARVVFTPEKRRAGGRRQLRSFQSEEASDNPDLIVRFLEGYTSGLRRLIEPKFNRRLFLFWSLALRERLEEQVGPAAFYGSTTGGGGEDSRFTHFWSLWCKEAGLGKVPFSSIRVTGLNLAHRAFSGDVRAIAALAAHSSTAVFDHHYKSPHSRARNDRKVAKAMLLRERMLASNGKVDPTRRLRGEGVQAATPGFGCLDPFSSPIPGQREGRTCSAYGQCPDCPLGTTDVRVPANLVRMKQLEAEYLAAASYLAPHYWRDKYLNHLGALRDEWLPAFVNRKVIDQAAMMQARPLPPLG